MAFPLVLAAGAAGAAASIIGELTATPKNTVAPGQAQAAAQDFEAVFLNTMFQQMFTGLDGEGPLGSGQGAGAGIWRSLLTDEYAKTVAKSGGVGLADHVYRALIAQQEGRP
jgi:Rod binding domain-containing protein